MKTEASVSWAHTRHQMPNMHDLSDPGNCPVMVTDGETDLPRVTQPGAGRDRG